MSVKIRLQRHGKKQKPFYWIVAADARSKRDGKYLEKLGTYNPNTNPATIDLNIDQTVQWLHNGAQPTDTARAILSYKGALLKHHLDGGIRKGALTQEQADAKLTAWIEEKAGKVDAKKDGLTKKQVDAKVKALKAEKVANEKRIAKVEEATKVPVVSEEETVEVVAEVPETPADETPEVEAVATEEVVAEVTEIPEVEAVASEEVVADVTETPEVEAVATEEVVAEVTETPQVEAAADETSATEEASEEKEA